MHHGFCLFAASTARDARPAPQKSLGEGFVMCALFLPDFLAGIVRWVDVRNAPRTDPVELDAT